jgi:CPA2 family monovalent cation:H+ antiporter-2
MHHTAHTGSRELFRLAVYAIALGVAFGAAKLFDVSFALGAFFAGVVMGESTLSQQATEEAMPLRDAFAVLFFVSVGMLVDPRVFVDAPAALLATVALIVVAKAAVAWLIVRAYRKSSAAALTVAAGRAQIGEFSFILIGLGMDLGLVPPLARDLVLSGAIISIVINPLVFALLVRRPQPAPKPAAPTPAAPVGHDVVIGYGRVGSLIGAALMREGSRLVVIETGEDNLERARLDGARTFIGNAADPDVLADADLKAARRLFVTIPEPFEAGQVVQQARVINPTLDILARAHTDAAVAHLAGLGASLVVLGEREIAERMIERARSAP